MGNKKRKLRRVDPASSWPNGGEPGHLQQGVQTPAPRLGKPKRSRGPVYRIPVSKLTVTEVYTPSSTRASCSRAAGKGFPDSGSRR